MIVFDIGQTLITSSVAGILVLIGLIIVIPPLRHKLANVRLHSMIKKLGTHYLHEIILPDGAEGTIYCEYLILQPKQVLLLSIKPYRGKIFAAEKIETWTQLTGNHSFKFSNPLQQLEGEAQYIRGLIPGVSVSTSVVFSEGSEFPKGKPETVLTFEDLKQRLHQSTDEIVNDKFLQAWQLLCSQAQPASAELKKLMSETNSVKPFVYAFVLFLLAALWVFWQLSYTF